MFLCPNPTCAISISKAEFPVAMPCPVCQTMLTAESSLNDEELALLQNLPYVIAYPLQKTLEEKHAWTKINLFKDTFLNYLKYLGLLTASEFFNSPFKDKRMVALFQQSLAEPSFGTWNHYIRETLAYLKEKEHSFFIPELPEYYEKVETGKKRKLYKGEIEFIDGNGDVQIKKQEATAIGMLNNFRNRYLGHGLTLDAATAEKLWEEYSPMFFEILRELKFTLDYKMYKYENDETFLLQSAQIVQKENNRKSNQVWLESPSGEVMDILPFYVVPGELTIRKEDKEQILAYESYTGKSIKFFSPEGTEKQTSGRILEKLNLLLRDKQKEKAYSPEEFTKEVFLSRVAEENKLILDTLIAEKKVIPGVYVHREDMEIKLRSWIGARANIFVIAAEAGSGKTNLLVEMQKQYTERELPTLLIRAGRMEKTTIHAQLCYLLNIDEHCNLNQYPAIAGTQEAPTYVLIDGLNEAHESEKLWAELFEISKHFEPGSLKFVVTSRANTAADINRYTTTAEQESSLYGDSKDKENQVSAYTHWLTALSMEEMKQAWEYYIAKDKGKFKPQFDFDDLATFDRALYNQISNPLVLRLFLETYQGKKLPNKGKQHLDIWSDWLSTFSQQEQDFFKDLADAIWEKGENELLLEDVLNNEILKSYFTTDQLNAPYPRLRNMGWISRYVKDLNTCLGFTVEGALLHILGKKLESHQPSIDITEIKQLLQTGSQLQRAGVGTYLQHLALKGDLNIVCELIDAGEEFIEACVIPIVFHLKTIGVKKTLDILLQNPTEHDWKALLKVDDVLKELTLHALRKELAIQGLPRNNFSLRPAIQMGLEGIQLIEKKEGEFFLSKIDLEQSHLINDVQICYNLGELFEHFGEYNKALELFLQCLKICLTIPGNQHLDVASTYNKIGGTYWHKGENDKALEFFQKSLDIKLKTLGNQHPDVATCYCNIGLAWDNKGEYNKALELHHQSLEIRLKTLGNLHPDVATSYCNIGSVWNYLGEYENAIQFFQKSLEIELKTLGNHHPYVAVNYNNIGTVLRNKGEYDKALDFLQKSLDIKFKTLGNQHPSLANSICSIGLTWSKKGEFEMALEFHQKGLDIRLNTLGKHHPDVAKSYNRIGNCLKELELYQEAIQAFKSSSEIQKEAGYLFQIGKCYEALSENHEALDYYIQSAEIRKVDPNAGIEAESTQESVKACIRLAKESGKVNELPEWMKEIKN
jgi:tetratricopeptide (TPR) repeat protein